MYVNTNTESSRNLLMEVMSISDKISDLVLRVTNFRN